MAVLSRTGLPRRRRLIPAFVLALVIPAAAGRLALDHTTSDDLTRAAFLGLIAAAVVVAGLAANAALAGGHAARLAGLGLLPVTALMIGGMTDVGRTHLLDPPVVRPIQSSGISPAIDSLRTYPMLQDSLRAEVDIAQAQSREYTFAATAYAYRLAPEPPVRHPWAALRATILLFGLLLLAMTIFPPRDGIALYSYRSDG